MSDAAIPDFELVRLRSGVLGIRSRQYDEVCHPGVGPRAEAEALYVQGLNLPGRWATTPGEFVVWDIGLGGAANATATIAAAGASATPVTLRVLSFDRSVEFLRFAVDHADELGYFGDLADTTRRLIEEPALEFRRGEARIHWQRVLGDFPALLASPAADTWPAPHAVLFDPHSPAANPEMWTLPFFRSLHARLDAARPTALATYSRGTSIRAALLLAGFYVGTGRATGDKEETTLAANRLELVGEPLGQRWLDRARRSRAAEPWTTPPFGGRPLTDATWNALRQHPQFALPPPPSAQ